MLQRKSGFVYQHRGTMCMQEGSPFLPPFSPLSLGSSLQISSVPERYQKTSKRKVNHLHLHCLFCPFRRPNNGLVYSVQFSLVTQSCLTLCDPRNCSTPGLPVHHQLPEFTHTRVHRVRDAIQPSHHLSSLSPPAPNPSQHQSLF